METHISRHGSLASFRCREPSSMNLYASAHLPTFFTILLTESLDLSLPCKWIRGFQTTALVTFPDRDLLPSVPDLPEDFLVQYKRCHHSSRGSSETARGSLQRSRSHNTDASQRYVCGPAEPGCTCAKAHVLWSPEPTESPS